MKAQDPCILFGETACLMMISEKIKQRDSIKELTEYMLPLTCILLYYYSSNLFYYYSGQKKKDQDFTTLKKYQDT
jgi:hypothetical protein